MKHGQDCEFPECFGGPRSRGITRYYIDILGFRKDPISAEGWSFLTRDSFRVMLGECVDERPAGELGNHSYFAYWNVEGVDDLYSELVGKGAMVSSPPTNSHGA